MPNATETFTINSVTYDKNPRTTSEKVGKTKLVAVTYTPELLARESASNLRLLATGIVPTTYKDSGGKTLRFKREDLAKALSSTTDSYRVNAQLEAYRLLDQVKIALETQGINSETLARFFSDYKHDSHEAADKLFKYLRTTYKDSTVVKTHQPTIIKWLREQTKAGAIESSYAEGFEQVFRSLTRPLTVEVDASTQATVLSNRSSRKCVRALPILELVSREVGRIRNTGTHRWTDVCWLIALATGRRCAEILSKNSKFEDGGDGVALYFTGQLKQHRAEGEIDKPNLIPCLIPVEDVLYLLSLIEHKRLEAVEGVDTGERVNKLYSMSLSKRASPEFKETLAELTTGLITQFKDCRLFYAAEATRRYSLLVFKPMPEDLYLSKILGHWTEGEQQTTAYRHYQQLEAI
jgi:hypothetical protein